MKPVRLELRTVITRLLSRPLWGFFGLAMLASQQPAYGAIGTGRIQVAIVTVGTLTKTADLDFGDIIAGTAPGTVTITPTGVRSATGGAVPVGNSFNAAAFAGRGSRRNQQLIVTLPTSILITRIGFTQTMTVDAFTMGTTPTLAAVAAGRRFRIVPADAIFDFPVGATLTVGAGQTPGQYRGQFTVDVAYQ